MRDPYEVLGLPRNATKEQVKAKYRELAKKYHPDNYIGTPLAETANEKMQEYMDKQKIRVYNTTYKFNSKNEFKHSCRFRQHFQFHLIS